MAQTQPSDPSYRKAADDIDAERNATIAYAYLCRLEEARIWLKRVLLKVYPRNPDVHQIIKNLPEAGVQLEQSLRDGVLLAAASIALLNYRNEYSQKLDPELLKLRLTSIYDISQRLSNFYRPDTPPTPISTASSSPKSNWSDKENTLPVQEETLLPQSPGAGTRFEKEVKTPEKSSRGCQRILHFRYTDNINIFFKTTRHLGLPDMFLPETTDIYESKNCPRLIYSIHSLAYLLQKNRYGTPTIRNISDSDDIFTEEQITEMERALQELGILDSLPQFNKIGGIIKREISRDRANEYAALLAVNLAIDEMDVNKFQNSLDKAKQYVSFNLVSESEFDQYLLVKLQDLKLNRTPPERDPEGGNEDNEADGLESLNMLGKEEIQEELDLFYFNRAIDLNDQGVFLRILARWGYDIPATHNQHKYFRTFCKEKQEIGEFVRATVDDLFHSIYECTERAEQWKQLEASGKITKIQALVRRHNERKRYLTRLDFLNSCEKEALVIQRWFRYQQLAKRANYFMENEEKIIALQRCFRGHLKKKRLALLGSGAFTRYVVAIQKWYRQQVHRRAYQDLLNSTEYRPVRLKNLLKFLHIYQANAEQQTAEEELLRQLKLQVVEKIQQNQEREVLSVEIEKKISHLITNRKTVEKLPELQKKLKRSSTTEEFVLEDGRRMKEFDDFLAKSELVVAHVAYDKPEILVDILHGLSHVKSQKFFTNVVLTIYQMGQSSQDLYQIVRIFEHLLEREYSERLAQKTAQLAAGAIEASGEGRLEEIIYKGQIHTVNLLIHKFCRLHGETQEGVKKLLKEICLNIVSESGEQMNTVAFDAVNEFMKIGKSPSMKMSNSGSAIGNGVLEKNSVSSIDSTSSQVLDIPEGSMEIVATKIKHHVTAIINRLKTDRGQLIPFHLKWICFKLALLLRKNDPDAKLNVTKIISHIICEKFLMPVINAPDGFYFFTADDTSTPRPAANSPEIKPTEVISSAARKSLGLVAHLFARCAKRQTYDKTRNPREADQFNGFIREQWKIVEKYIQQYVLGFTIEDSPRLYYRINDFTSLTKIKPQLQLRIGDLLDLLHKTAGKLDPEFPHSFLDSSGHAHIPEISFFDDRNSISGNYATNPTKKSPKNKSEKPSKRLSNGAQTEDAKITLTIRDTKTRDIDPEKLEMELRLAQIKELIVEVLPTVYRVAPKIEDLDGYFEFREDIFGELARRRKGRLGEEHERLAEVSKQVAELCEKLKEFGLLPEYGAYKVITHLIRTNILEGRKWRQIRQSETKILQNNLIDLDEKIKYVQKQLDLYNEYVETCLGHQQHIKDKKNSGATMKRGKNDGVMRQMTQRRDFKSKTLSFTAKELVAKNVISRIEDIPTAYYKHVQFEMSTVKSDVFHVKIKQGGTKIYSGELRLETLFDATAKDIKTLQLFDDKVHVDVNRMMFFVNKNFFKK